MCSNIINSFSNFPNINTTITAKQILLELPGKLQVLTSKICARMNVWFILLFIYYSLIE